MNASPDRAPDAWTHHRAGFLATHQDAVNVALHLITTPLGVLGALVAAAWVHPAFAVAVSLVWTLSWAGRVPHTAWRAAAATMALLTAATLVLPASLPVALALLLAGWLGQTFAHAGTGEGAYSDTYAGDGEVSALAAHTWLVLPLVIEAAMQREQGLLRPLMAQGSVFRGRIGPAERPALERLAAWVHAQDPSRATTTHWWPSDLPPQEAADFHRLAHCDAIYDALRARHGQGAWIASVAGMDEVYVAGPEPKMTSDTVFYRAHVDGPFAVLPFVTVYRVMLAITPNQRIRTVFDMLGEPHARYGGALDEGEIVGFDYHRELHRIEVDPTQPEPDRRVALKIHVAACPRFLAPWGRFVAWASTAYNRRARQLFLDTIAPTGLFARLGAGLVLATTRGFDLLQTWVGAGNAVWALAWTALSAATGRWELLLAATSYVHYLLYVSVFAHRRDVAAPTFRRDALFYKTLAMGQLAGWALALSWGAPWQSLVLPAALAVAGFGTAAVAAAALGPVRTWFGAELGIVPHQRVTAWPYGSLPHPMILGAMVGLTGVHLLPGFAEALPWLVPVHLAFYTAHLLQEAWEPADAPEPAR